MKRNVTVVRQRLSLEAYNCTKELWVSEVYDFLEELTKRLDMRIIVPPIVVKVPTVNAAGNIATEDYGTSGTLIWLESGTHIHLWPHQAFGTLDVFSCKRYDPQVVINLMSEWLGTIDIEVVN